MTIQRVFRDGFVEATDTLLTAHTPSVDSGDPAQGLGWDALAGNSANNATINASEDSLNQPFNSGNIREYYSIDTTESPSDFQRVTMIAGTVLSFAGLRLSDGASDANGYVIEFAPPSTNRVTLYRIDNGTMVELDSDFNNTITSGSVLVAEISAVNGIRASVDGNFVTWEGTGTDTVTDNTYSGGKAGWVGRRSYTSGGITSFEAEYDVVAGNPPTGTVTIGTITPGVTTASAAFTYDNTDQTGFDYRLDNGSPVNGGATSPISITGLTASTTYSLQIRATNTDGAGAWSTAQNFTTNAVPVGTIESSPMRDNGGQVLANENNVTVEVYNPVSGVLVARTTTASSNAQGVISFSDAAIENSTSYRINYLTTSAGIGTEVKDSEA